MLTNEDLPEPWRVVASPIPAEDALALDKAGGTDSGDLDLVSWDMIENTQNGRRVLLRMEASTPEGAPAITGLYVASGQAGSVGIGEVRQLPLAAIEAAARGRLAHSRALLQAVVVAGPDVEGGPIGRPSGPDDHAFFARLAIRYADVARTSSRPATDLAQAEGVTTRTVQRWTTRARQLGLLPAGRPGRTS